MDCECFGRSFDRSWTSVAGLSSRCESLFRAHQRDTALCFLLCTFIALLYMFEVASERFRRTLRTNFNVIRVANQRYDSRSCRSTTPASLMVHIYSCSLFPLSNLPHLGGFYPILIRRRTLHLYVHHTLHTVCCSVKLAPWYRAASSTPSFVEPSLTIRLPANRHRRVAWILTRPWISRAHYTHIVFKSFSHSCFRIAATNSPDGLSLVESEPQNNDSE